MRITNVARLNVEVSDPIQMQALASQNIEPVKIMKNVRDAGFLQKKGAGMRDQDPLSQTLFFLSR